ncbi:MAG: hypothetical protein IT373_17120, partial [Polyangiaceae bacterium]|nr:hypothetical protein [Polyangiaceae bacterium]
PMAGAHVRIQARDEGTVTDANGAYSLPNASGPVVVVAAEVGYFNEGVAVTAPATGVELELEKVPSDEDPDYPFLSPGACALCHVQQFTEWLGSDMGKAGTNTWVADTYDGSGTPGGLGGFVYTRDSGLAAANPESECRACHQPEAWAREPYSALGPVQNPSVAQAHGVSCEVCHKVANIDETKPSYPGLWPGVVTLTRPLGFQVMYGVLDDVDYTMLYGIRASYQPQLSAALCAACHQDKNDPDDDGDFEEANGIVSEPTYLEWRDSPYADPGSEHYATCVSCHMPASGLQICSVLPNMQRPRGQVRSHELRGTTPGYLENAVELDVEASLVGSSVEADVTVTNSLTGHHVPTGVTTRNVILLVDAWRASSGTPLVHTGAELVHETGGLDADGLPDPAHGYYGGMPGKLFAKVNHDGNGNGPVFFTDATGITFDTRIPALGADTTHYSFAAPLGGGPVHVRARLLYRRAWRALVDAKGWTRTGHDQPLADIAPPLYGHLMEEGEVVVDTPPECVTPDDCPPGQGLVCVDGVCAVPGTGGAGGEAGAAGSAGAAGAGGTSSGGAGGAPGAGLRPGGGCGCAQVARARAASDTSDAGDAWALVLAALALGTTARRARDRRRTPGRA